MTPGEGSAHLARVGVLHRHTQVRAGLLVRRCVGDVETQQPHVDFVEGVASAENVEELLFGESRLGPDVEAGEHHGHCVTEAAHLIQRHLQRVRRRTAFRTADRDAVLTLLSQPDGVEVGDDVGAEVGRFSGLVEQLGGDRAD